LDFQRRANDIRYLDEWELFLIFGWSCVRSMWKHICQCIWKHH